MDTYESFSPPGGTKPDPRWPEEEAYATRTSMDSYRRRSPTSQDRRRNRGRSRSPVGIDRYQPADRERLNRDEYYNAPRDHAARDREQRRRVPSPMSSNIDRYVPGQDATKPILRSNPIPNPFSLDYPVGFNYYAEWWRTEESIKEEKERIKHGGRRPTDRVKGDREARESREKERAQIQTSYDAYKIELQVKLARQFVQHHHNEEWFKERYVAEVRDPFRQRLNQFRSGIYDQWSQDISSGYFDEFTLEGIYKSESDGAGGVIEKEEGEATAVGETLGVLDLVPSKGGDLRDESVHQPALLIKTLAPNVTREKIEEFSKEHLGEGEGGFRWLSLSDPNPSKKYHRIGWIMLHPSSEPNPVFDRGDGRDEEGEETEATSATEAPNISTADKALEAINGKTIQDPLRGDFICHVGVHVPPAHPRKKALWDLFSAPERIERDLALARRIAAKFEPSIDGADGIAKIDERVEDIRARGWLQPPAAAPTKAKKDKSFDIDQDMILLDEGEAEEGEEQEDGFEDEADTEDFLVKKKTLDLIVEYLRRVYNFCFFCVFESDSIHELVRKCPGGHLRRPRSGLSNHAKAAAKASALGQPYPTKKFPADEEEEGEASPAEEKKPTRFTSKSAQQIYRAFNWVKTFEDKLLQILEPENADLTKLGGKPVEEALDEELSRFVKQEDESKFRCKVPECTKLFKAQHFWRKHIEKRHPEWYSEIQRELALVNAYVLDPAHISPTRSDAASNGHFPFPPGYVPAGTPRGFNFANMSMNFGAGGPPGGGMPGVAGSAPGYPGMLNNGNWPGVNAADPSSLHTPGVIRRGGGRYAHRTGPYDRRGGRHGGPPMNARSMFGAPGGRMPNGGSGVYIPAGHPAALAAVNVSGARWGDGAGSGVQAMGPKEAVQGRSLKSYEDLDAMDGQGNGELNY
ncbi:hypothetical protein FQN57_001207 [Myotisia sp. PD_48]|nr:hypothetical protein FQN57_001207 [Myotisia sp. PD_48]